MIHDNRIKQYGLNSEEAEQRIKKYGKNQIENKKSISPILIFIRQFNDLMVWVLIGATIISSIMGDRADAITIILIVIMNAIMGFIQEFRTEKSLEALKQMAAPTAKVIRDEKLQIINAELLVPGDLIIIESGDRIPADCTLVENNNLIIDEALLTGESVGVIKNLGNNNKVYMATTVLIGKGEAVITATGMNTEMGKIAHMLQNIQEEKSPLKERLEDLGKILVILCLLICIVVTVMGILKGKNIYDMFLLGVSLAVAAIPEGLPAIVTVALALGVSRMLKKNALIRKLPAVETLGCTSIICTDKTGTLTQNLMTLKKVYVDGKIKDIDDVSVQTHERLKEIFALCCDCDYNFDEGNMQRVVIGDPTETALIKGFFQKKESLRGFLNGYKKYFEIPFDSNRKMMSVLFKNVEGNISYVKGAPERVLPRCKYIMIDGQVKPITDVHIRGIKDAVEALSDNALRCLAGAYKVGKQVNRENMEQDLVFVAITGIIDPPRKEAKEAVRKCIRAGIKPIMITGDHKNTAYAIGKELLICKDKDEVITGDELDKISDEDFMKISDKIKIFARVSPHHKYRIVKSFKKKGNIVAMTGDGVNDAPAIKESDIGISMGISGTDVTKEAAAMILLDDNFSTIVSAVEEGRVIYSNIRKFIRYLLSCNLGEVLTMFLASVYGLETPLLPIQILLVNLATDGLPAIALGMDPSDKEAMLQKPRQKNESIFANGLKEKIMIRGTLIGICTILAFIVGMYKGYDLKTCRTLALGTLIMSQLIHVFECKSENNSLFEINILDNLYLVASVLISVVLLISIIYVPMLSNIFHTSSLNLSQWAIIGFFSGVIAFISSVYMFIRKHNK
ncbi:calcium-translocating P-type ATPase, PMCA-type [Clostridium cellulovorans]|uniref:P-type Ca(2+) transporter n=1 Tax=Clostridium cellulovorans (strain ATCC 35296 / DSM 3052 / OCM 3 / 743B) TaxID=573061 RepID=D9SKJ0_CLOC7|nr:calcium-translocating P-type ATPase, PMCA-type [Clostridium cellulovorans]ADL51486.1 ATPase, P-type (transporting), HAD superfamily, subfamily IC [Clostridium cellulovorans 743B]